MPRDYEDDVRGFNEVAVIRSGSTQVAVSVLFPRLVPTPSSRRARGETLLWDRQFPQQILSWKVERNWCPPGTNNKLGRNAIWDSTYRNEATEKDELMTSNCESVRSYMVQMTAHGPPPNCRSRFM